ncbi:MAG: cupin [Alphaproteobacteria bacterium]
MSSQKIEHVAYKDYIPCRTAFIDAHTPGSDQKENYTIVGGGVSESPDQHVHINRKPGFNIGAAAQPAICTNSLHSHNTAEVFIIHSGSWSFYWGEHGDEGECLLEPGDVISLPTHMFRGFKNMSAPTDDNPDGYGFIFAVLGGDDAGGGVIWAPHVLEAAKDHGLVLMENGQLIDTKAGQALPEGVQPMEPVSGDMKTMHTRNRIDDAGKVVVKRDQGGEFEIIIGEQEQAFIRERPGFRLLRWIGKADAEVGHPSDLDMVLIVNEGNLMFQSGDISQEVGTGDTLYIQAGDTAFNLTAGSQGATAFLVRPTDDPAGETDYL